MKVRDTPGRPSIPVMPVIPVNPARPGCSEVRHDGDHHHGTQKLSEQWWSYSSNAGASGWR